MAGAAATSADDATLGMIGATMPATTLTGDTATGMTGAMMPDVATAKESTTTIIPTLTAVGAGGETSTTTKTATMRAATSRADDLVTVRRMPTSGASVRTHHEPAIVTMASTAAAIAADTKEVRAVTRRTTTTTAQRVHLPAFALPPPQRWLPTPQQRPLSGRALPILPPLRPHRTPGIEARSADMGEAAVPAARVFACINAAIMAATAERVIRNLLVAAGVAVAINELATVSELRSI